MAAGGDQKLCNSLSEFFDGYIEQFADTIPTAANNSDVDNIFFSTLEEVLDPQKSSSSSLQLDQAAMETMSNISPCRRKRQKLMTDHHPVLVEDHEDGGKQQKLVSHIAVERNRRKQMNQHLTVLRSLMPCFYVKRGDQASIIGGVVDYITELQQVLQSLEAKKQRKVYSDHVLSPRCSPLSPRSKPPLSPRPLLPISPRTPQPLSPYRSPCWLNQPHQLVPNPSNYSLIANMSTASPYSPASSSNSSNTSDIVNELVANSKSNINIADVEVKFCGSNLVLKTVSPRLPGQITKIVSVLEDLSLEIIQAGVNTVDDTMVNSFTIKIGIECRLSVEDLVQHIKQTFC